MLANDIKLYTWIDVERAIEDGLNSLVDHEWLIGTKAYWNGLSLQVKERSSPIAVEWLREVFSPRITFSSPTNETSGIEIDLEYVNGHRRPFPVEFEEVSDEPLLVKPTPTFARQIIPVRVIEPPKFKDGYPPILAFHSFKGEVGRTVSAILAALRLRKDGAECLLIDADMEAPGISWMLGDRMPDPPVSYADFLALVHSDHDSSSKQSVELVAHRLKDMVLDDIYVLPAFRSVRHFHEMDIRPEHLHGIREHNYELADLLSELGKAVGVDVVIVDLRAGLTEISAGLILDPRVDVAFVTTTSAQSLEGTIQLLNLCRKKMITDDVANRSVILTQVTREFRDSDRFIEAETKIYNALFSPSQIRIGHPTKPLSLTDDGQYVMDLDTDIEVSAQSLSTIEFKQDLIGLDREWDACIDRFEDLGLPELMSGVTERLPINQSDHDIVIDVTLAGADLFGQRRKLGELAKKQIYAESGHTPRLLATSALRHLSQGARTKLPFAVVVGAKGSGKTHTFMVAVRSGTWQSFAMLTGDYPIDVEAEVFPFLWSSHLSADVRREFDQTRLNLARKLNLGTTPASQTDIADWVTEHLEYDLTETAWRKAWLDLIAWSLGYKAFEMGAGSTLHNALQSSRQQVVIAVDGLEDLFRRIDSEQKAKALRTLLVDTVNWLNSLPPANIGTVIFVRRDLVTNSLSQNSGQFLGRHSTYALRWDRSEALRLASWILRQACYGIDNIGTALGDIPESDLENDLITLWGKKLGKPNSREGYSSNWVIAALSDLNGLIQARDMVRFIQNAAQKSQSDLSWNDRLLVPPGIKNAIPICAKAKVDEVGEELPALQSVFDKIRNVDVKLRQLPFALETFGLTVEDVDILIDNGVIDRPENGQVQYMPMIFRYGLDFKVKGTGRAKVYVRARTGAS